MASKNVNVEALFPAKDDRTVYLNQDPINLMLVRTEAVAKSVDQTADEMGTLFRKFIQCAKYQDIQSEDYSQLSDTIGIVQQELEKLKIYLCCIKILNDTPEA
jgi:hypothetical protein